MKADRYLKPVFRGAFAPAKPRWPQSREARRVEDERRSFAPRDDRADEPTPHDA